MTVERPRLLVLDTSQLSSLIRDAYSADRIARQRAVTFEGRLADAGILMLIFSHHIDELLQHQNDATAARRMDYIALAQKRPTLVADPVIPPSDAFQERTVACIALDQR